MDEKIKFVPIYTTFDQGIIALIKSLLDANEVSYYVDNEHAAGLAASRVPGEMTVMVAKKQAGLAEELLKEIRE